LYFATRSAIHASMAASSNCAPSRSTHTATPTSPHFASGTPTMATSLTDASPDPDLSLQHTLRGRAVADLTAYRLTPVSMGIYLYAGELYPTRMRAWGTGIAASWIRIAAFVAPIAVAAVLSAGLGIGAVFLMFAIATAVGWTVMFRFGPETRLRVLEEIAV